MSNRPPTSVMFIGGWLDGHRKVIDGKYLDAGEYRVPVFRDLLINDEGFTVVEEVQPTLANYYYQIYQFDQYASQWGGVYHVAIFIRTEGRVGK